MGSTSKKYFWSASKVAELQSEAGAAGRRLHGSLQAGAITTTYTASQGLLLMIPNMYKIAGELLPCVIHVAARALATSSLNIFGDHQDVMARQTGFAMLAETSVQEVMDLSGVAHLATLKSRMPFMSFFDGFRTSHEIQKIEVIEQEELAKLVDYKAIDDLEKSIKSKSSCNKSEMAQNPDIYFQTREAVNTYYDEVPDIVEKYMGEITKLTGRVYHCFDYYGWPDADRIIISMGAVNDVVEETVDFLNANKQNVGLVKVRLYRPFSMEKLLKVIPKTVRKIAVLDRTKEPGSIGEPLYLDALRCFFGKENAPCIVGGRFGLGSKDPTPVHIAAVFDNLILKEPKNNFTIGIIDDVTKTSLNPLNDIDATPEGITSCKFWGLGSDGTVGANKSSY